MPTDWSDFLLEQNPQWAYISSSPFTPSNQQGFAAAQQNYWRGQFGNVWNRYMGELGSATRQGQDYGSFSDYLEDKPFSQIYYQNVAPSARNQNRYNPTTRYLF